MSVVRTPGKKNLVAFGADEFICSEGTERGGISDVWVFFFFEFPQLELRGYVMLYNKVSRRDTKSRMTGRVDYNHT